MVGGGIVISTAVWKGGGAGGHGVGESFCEGIDT